MSALSSFTPEMAPPSARWMGMNILEHRPDEMYSRVSFDPNSDMINFGGVIQGGFLGAMMDDAMGFNTFISLGMKYAMATIDLHTQFLKAVPMQPLDCEAWVTKAGKSVVFAEAKLYIEETELAARATSSLKLRPFTGPQFPTGVSKDG